MLAWHGLGWAGDTAILPFCMCGEPVTSMYGSLLHYVCHLVTIRYGALCALIFIIESHGGPTLNKKRLTA